MKVVELLIAVNPDPDSRLPFLLRVPLGWWAGVPHVGDVAADQGAVLLPGGGLEWPAEPEIVERAGVALVRAAGRGDRSGAGPGAGEPVADGVHDRAGPGGGVWQSARTRKQARPNVTTPTARAAGIARAARSWWIPTSSTPIGSPPSRSR